MRCLRGAGTLTDSHNNHTAVCVCLSDTSRRLYFHCHHHLSIVRDTHSTIYKTKVMLTLETHFFYPGSMRKGMRKRDDTHSRSMCGNSYIHSNADGRRSWTSKQECLFAQTFRRVFFDFLSDTVVFHRTRYTATIQLRAQEKQPNVEQGRKATSGRPKTMLRVTSLGWSQCENA